MVEFAHPRAAKGTQGESVSRLEWSAGVLRKMRQKRLLDARPGRSSRNVAKVTAVDSGTSLAAQE
jgi:hypothetical protein